MTARRTSSAGRYGRVLPARLLEAYQLSRDDPNALSLSDELALIDARLIEVLGRLTSGESKPAWRSLGELATELEREVDGWDYCDDPDVTRRQIMRLASQIAVLARQALGDEHTWADVRSLIDQRARTGDGERRRLLDLDQMLDRDQAQILVDALITSVREHVKDAATLSAIARDFDGALGVGGLRSAQRALAQRV